MKLELIEWYDSHSPAAQAWIKTEDIDHDPLLCTSVGFVINENKHAVSLAAHTAEIEVSGVMVIPKAVIKKRKKLKHA